MNADSLLETEQVSVQCRITTNFGEYQILQLSKLKRSVSGATKRARTEHS